MTAKERITTGNSTTRCAGFPPPTGVPVRPPADALYRCGFVIRDLSRIKIYSGV